MYVCVCVCVCILRNDILRNEVGVLEMEHAVKVEDLCVLILLCICSVIPQLYMCRYRSEAAVLATEHAVNVMLLTKPLCLYPTN